MSMHELCRKCNICNFMPRQEYDRVLSLVNSTHYTNILPDKDDDISPVLVIDDVNTEDEWIRGGHIALNLLAEQPNFEYTSTIRCYFESGSIHFDDLNTAVRRCSVWTNLLTSDRSLTLATKTALHQLKTGKEHLPGDMFKSGKYGLILVIEPLLSLSPRTILEYKTKIERLLKAGVK